MSRLYDEELRCTGLKATQYTLLRGVAKVGPVSQQRLCELFIYDHTTVSRNLRPLEQAGYVMTRHGSSDRRQRVVEITKAGQRLLAEAEPHWQRAQARVKRKIGADAWATLRATLPVAADALLEV